MPEINDHLCFGALPATRLRTNINANWEFKRETDSNSDDPGCDWKLVNLPHWGRLERYDVSRHFQGLCYYKKTIAPTSEMAGKKVIIEFEAGMSVATVRVNGYIREWHDGGYLPFFVDVSEEMSLEIPAIIEVELDNLDNPDVPPGKPLAGLDFCYFSGLYRNVWMHVTDPVHITDANLVQRVGGGGVFVRYENVTAESADILTQIDVVNEALSLSQVFVAVSVYGAGEQLVASAISQAVTLGAGEAHAFSTVLTLTRPALWSPDSPNLYTLKASVVVGIDVRDTVTLRIGVRTLKSDPVLGFFLNGERLQPFGANRHQSYPYIGNAVPDNAQYRDAVKLKAAGFDLIRLSHYPQSTSFLDACDELGLMALVCIPGWQHFSDTPRFRGNVINDLRQTIRRDRNHPCTVLWEASLNETLGHDDIITSLIDAAAEEYPGDQMLTCGDTEGHGIAAPKYSVPYSGWDGKTKTRPNIAGQMSLHREYGDNQFGGYSRYSRGDGETLMLVQAWNYQTAINEQNALDYTWGQCVWESIDNNRGMSDEIATCGTMDPFRLPKFLYHFFESQRSPATGGPSIFIANYWLPTRDPSIPVVVYSNCDEVELFVNGRFVEKRTPDDGPDIPFGDLSGFDANYWLHSDQKPTDTRNKDVSCPIFNGGNCGSLKRPPFTFRAPGHSPGVITAIGYINGVKALETSRVTPAPAHAVSATFDFSGRPLIADGSDTIFVYASVIDAHGNIVPSATNKIHFDISGDADLIGDNPREAEAGIATILLRAGASSGRLRLVASAVGLLATETFIEQI